MSQPKYSVIINPASGNGSTIDQWESIKDLFRQRLGEFDFFLTRGPGDASEHAQNIDLSENDVLIVVGGDGTLNEVINGLLSEKRQGKPTPKLGILSTGRGSDYVRTLGVPLELRTAVDHIKDAHTKAIDVGIVEIKNAFGVTQRRYLVNGASVGMGGFVARRLQRKTSQLPSRLVYLSTTVESIFKYKSQPLKVLVGDHVVHEGKAINIFVCNGRYSGGGMHWAPQAQLDDSKLDLVIVGDMPVARLLKSTIRLYDGSVQTVPGVRHMTADDITISCPQPQVLEIDGECFDVQEAKFGVLSRCLRVIL